jgi:hypothetical protein
MKTLTRSEGCGWRGGVVDWMPSSAALPAAAALVRAGSGASAPAPARRAAPRCSQDLQACHALRGAHVWNVEAGGARFAVGPLPKFGQAGLVVGFMGTTARALSPKAVATQAFLSLRADLRHEGIHTNACIAKSAAAHADGAWKYGHS